VNVCNNWEKGCVPSILDRVVDSPWEKTGNLSPPSPCEPLLEGMRTLSMKRKWLIPPRSRDLHAL
jgi:hypothetical protein